MIKFIIEVDEEFISSNADMNKRAELTETGAKDSIIKLLMFMPYSTINDEIKEGKTEFTISPNCEDNDEYKQRYESIVDHTALVVATNLLEERNEAKTENIDKTNK